MDFKLLSQSVKAQFESMAQDQLFVANVDKYEIWETYLEAFPEGTNPIYKERTEHDCNCCKQFIRTVGGAVTIVDGQVKTIWDVQVGGFYQVVADALAAYVRSKAIKNQLLHFEARVGKNTTVQLTEEGSTITWDHFEVTIPRQYVKTDIDTILSHSRANHDVLKRSLEEITLESAQTVLELIDQNSLYRGEEHRSIVNKFIQLKRAFDQITDDKSIFLWEKSMKLKGASRIRNSVIGSLLSDLSDGRDLEGAVKSFEEKVAPSNYKRPKALVTKGMIDQAQKKVAELGFESALGRRYAEASDITINNVLFADRDVQPVMKNVFDDLREETPSNHNFDKVEEVSVEKFINDIVPGAHSIEAFVENKHNGNFFSLIAPQDTESSNMFKWDNNFSWSYNGEVADSMKAQVKAAGGNVEGEFRASLAWYSRNDLDLHLVEPNGHLISYNCMGSSNRKGRLDVDNTRGGTKDKPAVENIFWPKASDMQEGKYKILVHNYAGSNTNEAGFDFELEFKGEIYNMSYARPTIGKVVCVEFMYTHAKGIEILNSLPTTKTSKQVWGVNTENFRKVNMIMNSPNHWDGNQTGNKHYFFVLDKCANEDSSRGFYNEFLNEELTPHRKVFEILGSKLRVEHSENQLSGLGFSSTQRSSALFKVKGNFNRTVKVLF